MKVKATQLGYYNHIRQKEGSVFELKTVRCRDPKTKKVVEIPPEKQFSERWMEKVDEEAETKGKPSKSTKGKKDTDPEETGGDEVI